MKTQTWIGMMVASAAAGYLAAHLPAAPRLSQATPGRTPSAERTIPEGRFTGVPPAEIREQILEPVPHSNLEVFTPLLDAFLGDLTEAQLETLLEFAIRTETSVHSKIVEEFFATEEPHAHDLIRRGLSWADGEILGRLIERFSVEDLRSRREALAWFIGYCPNLPESQALLTSILEGTDRGLTHEVLKELEAGDVAEERAEEVARILRTLVQPGEPVDLRLAATQALDGDESPHGIRFLMDLVEMDPQIDVRISAVWSLPSYFPKSQAENRNHIMLRLFAVIEDPKTAPGLRHAAARRLNGILDDDDTLLDKDQKGLVNRVVEEGSTGAPR